MTKLQYISQGNTADEQLANIEKVLDNGVQWVQLRWKNAPAKNLYSLAEKVKKLCEVYTNTLIINDNANLAKEIDADGVHLGLEDMAIYEAREILGDNKIIGGTANTLENILQRIEEKCDYIGLGPLRFTATKEKLNPVLGLDGYAYIMQELKNKSLTPPPIYAIGGIGIEDITPLLQLGIYGVAVSKIITEHPKYTQQLLKHLV